MGRRSGGAGEHGRRRMARTTTRYVCQKCGHEEIRWLGRCPDCSSWNSFTEEVTVPRGAPSLSRLPGEQSAAPQRITDVSLDDHPRLPTGLGEFDRVLGGGIVPGSLVLIGGDPGIGKSTLLGQVAGRISAAHGPTLYVTGEESVQQVKMRADRLGVAEPELLLAAETEMDAVEAHVANLKPRFVIIDSIQTMHDGSIASASATVSQVRACTARLMRLAKSTHTTVFIVGHVTKEGTIAGPRVLEHIVDTVLYFEGDRFQAHRLLRAVKNRFGSTDELGIFEMGEAGLTEVENASELLLAERPAHGSGSAVVAVIEGTRPLLVEVQALVAHSYLTSPRRMTTGVDYNRTCMILAVLEKRVGLRMADKDVYVNVAGGLKLTEPAVDLGIAMALASSYRDIPVDPELVVAGEVGLAGEVRAVQQIDKRLKEAARLGFRRALVAGRARRRPGGQDPLLVQDVATVRDAVAAALVPEGAREQDGPWLAEEGEPDE
jgi:DNA repair protein RadA/Sms